MHQQPQLTTEQAKGLLMVIFFILVPVVVLFTMAFRGRSQAKARFCTNCGKTLPVRNSFCESCGSRVTFLRP